jgi:hypothetical protein
MKPRTAIQQHAARAAGGLIVAIIAVVVTVALAVEIVVFWGSK